MGPVIEFSVLGPLEVRTPDRGVVPIGSALQRALLVRLLVEPGRVVSVDRLVEDLWGDDPPHDPANALRYHVWQLRDALDPDREARSEGRYVKTKPPGYFFDPAGAWIDLVEFDRLRADGHALVESDPARAASLLRAALGLWRADALADVADHEFAADEARRFEECRLLALEDRIAADLGCGLADELIPDLEGLVARHPWRERVRGQLMVALFRSGRQAEALAVYREARELLGRELGIEPSPELRAIEEQVVLQDAALVVPRDVSVRSNLPAPLASFVGRDAEIDELQELLERHRLVTLVGPPGVGKTRLAIETARARVDRHEGGVWLVDLALGGPGDDIADLLADVLGLDRTATRGHPRLVEEQPSALASVVEYLRTRQVLVVLDNCERLLDEVARTTERILASCPSVTVLATSRRTIGLGGERILELQPLAVADDRAIAEDGWSALLASPAGELFVDRSSTPTCNPHDQDLAASVVRSDATERPVARPGGGDDRRGGERTGWARADRSGTRTAAAD